MLFIYIYYMLYIYIQYTLTSIYNNILGFILIQLKYIYTAIPKWTASNGQPVGDGIRWSSVFVFLAFGRHCFSVMRFHLQRFPGISFADVCRGHTVCIRVRESIGDVVFVTAAAAGSLLESLFLAANNSWSRHACEVETKRSLIKVPWKLNFD